MSKYIFVLIFCSVAVGCASTKVFMGSYDVVKIAVLPNQARMTAENFPHEEQSSGEKLEKKISEESICVDATDSDSCKASNFKGKLHVSILCSDKNLIKELSNHFYESGFTVEKRFHKPSSKATIISKVTIYPKKKSMDDPEGEYHLIEFKTMDGLNDGTYMVLIKTPLVFIFWPMDIITDTKEIKMVILHARYDKENNFIVKEDVARIVVDVNTKNLSEIISTTKKQIRIIFSEI